MKKEMEKKRSTLEAEGTVLRAISLMLVKEEGMRSLMGRFVKLITLLPRRLPIFDPSFCFCESLKSQLTNVNRSGEWRVESGDCACVGLELWARWTDPSWPSGLRIIWMIGSTYKAQSLTDMGIIGNENDFIIISIYFSEKNNNNNGRWWDQREGLSFFISFLYLEKTSQCVP